MPAANFKPYSKTSMNNSDLLSPDEEKLAAYLDGRLPAAEAATFEREHPEAFAEKADVAKLSQLLRSHSTAPTLRHRDFFNHQILREIAPAPVVQKARALWPLWRLAFAGACCLLAVFAFLPSKSSTPRYLAQVLSVTAGDPGITAEALTMEGVSVVWVDGLDFLPSNYTLE